MKTETPANAKSGNKSEDNPKNSHLGLSKTGQQHPAVLDRISGVEHTSKRIARLHSTDESSDHFIAVIAAQPLRHSCEVNGPIGLG